MIGYEFVSKWLCMKDKDLFTLFGEPKVSKDGTKVLYGLYPQTVVWSQKLIKTIEKEGIFDHKNGTYRFDGDLYVKVNNDVRHYGKNYFNNLREVKYQAVYWFKCRQISWKILSKNGNIYFLLSEKILDGFPFGSPNFYVFKGYGESSIRAWLNKDFFNFAFYYGNKNILTTIVNNEPKSTSFKKNENACENTYDKVFLLCYKDLFKQSYGFSNINVGDRETINNYGFWEYDPEPEYVSDTFSAEITDYAILKKGTPDNDYWTRSPSREYGYVWYVNGTCLRLIEYNGISGRLVGGSRNNPVRTEQRGKHPGVRPAIMIKIK